MYSTRRANVLCSLLQSAELLRTEDTCAMCCTNLTDFVADLHSLNGNCKELVQTKLIYEILEA